MPIKLAKQLLREPVHNFRQRRATPTIQQLANHQSEVLSAIGLALQQALNDEFSPEERAVFSQIEKRRSNLLGDHSSVNLIDYGAGSRGDNRSKREMDEGRPSTSTVSVVAQASKPEFWATLLYKFVYGLKPQSCIELGTCVGISAAYQAAALRANNSGKLLTLEGAPDVVAIAKATMLDLELPQVEIIDGPFHSTLRTSMETANPVDYFYNDGHHDRDAVLEYFNLAYPNLSENAVMVLDDIAWSSGMKTAWSKIINDERVYASIDLGQIGLVVMGKQEGEKLKFKMPSSVTTDQN